MSVVHFRFKNAKEFSKVVFNGAYISLAELTTEIGDGMLHMGHVRVYTISDCLARFHRASGRDVIHPMGWDAFGLPAENAAVERNIAPSDWTKTNIVTMREQMDMLGLNFDWDRELTTCDPSYYKWTQWLFLKMHSKGLAYRKEAMVNWDPVDNTVLANEQVDNEGRSWRSGAVVEQRSLKQWFFKITDYANRLTSGLDSLQSTGWPRNVIEMQRQWIGLSEGVHFDFKVASDEQLASTVRVFTTRPETIYGATFIAVAPTHPVLNGLTSDSMSAETRSQVEELAHDVAAASIDSPVDSARAVETGLFVTHPFTGKPLPVYAAGYVLAEYGSGAVMGVPAHDDRDWAMAKAKGLPIVSVIAAPSDDAAEDTQAYTVKEGSLVGSGEFDGMRVAEGAAAIAKHAEEMGCGAPVEITKLRDWLISRQRYWGTPIPMVTCKVCGDVPVPEDQLPVVLPEMTQNLKLTGAEGTPLSTMRDWVEVPCPNCGAPAERCTDTMDTFVDSSWYYLRYLDANNDREICDRAAAEGMPVDVYVGGIEHAILHLLYARFLSYVMKDSDLSSVEEPFARLLTQGMVHGKTMTSSVTGRPLKPSEVDTAKDGEAKVEIETGAPVQIAWAKMSKSKYNGIDPGEIVEQYGADTARVFMLFKAPPDAVLEWDSNAINGVHRWLGRVWNTVHDGSTAWEHAQQSGSGGKKAGSIRDEVGDEEVVRATHAAISSVTAALGDKHSFNTAVSDLMKLTNTLRATPAEHRGTEAYIDAIRTLLVMLAPAAPHIASELWTRLASLPAAADKWDPEANILAQRWPEADLSLLEQSEVEVAVQIGGKFRGSLTVPAAVMDEADPAVLAEIVAASALGQKWMPSDLKNIVRTIIPGNKKMVGFVLKGAGRSGAKKKKTK